MSLVDGVQTVNASSSDPKNPYDNLNSGVSGFWCSDASKDLPAWLNFDLGKNFLLEKIRVISTEQQNAPKEICVDYFGNDLRLIGRDIEKFTFDASSGDYSKYQEFPITDKEHAVKYVRIRVLSAWGGNQVQLNAILFFGDESQKGVKAVPMAGPGEEDPTYVPQQWYVGDRVRYRWEVGQKWYEGRILHINEGPQGLTYLVKDDSGWVKDHITPRNTREPRYRRKPRKLKASCTEISLKPIVEALEEGDEDDIDDDSEEVEESISSIDDDEKSDMLEPEPKAQYRSTEPTSSSPKENPPPQKEPSPPLHTKRPVAPPSQTTPNKTDPSPSARSPNSSSRGRPSSQSQSAKRNVFPGTSSDSNSSGGKGMHNTLQIKGFKMKRLNGVYKIRPGQWQGGRPLFRNAKGLVVWWFSDVKTWMISQQHLVGTDKSYAFVRDTAYHPLEIKGRWKTYNKISKSWDSDPGTIAPAPESVEVVIPRPNKASSEEEDNRTLAQLREQSQDKTKSKSAKSTPAQVYASLSKNPKKKPVKPVVKPKGESVPWKVVLSGFRVPKLNSIYLRQRDKTAGRHVFVSPKGGKKERLVLWWYNRRKFWMVSPKSLVGTDKSYACIQHVSMHPQDISGTWQVFDTGLRKFTNDTGAWIESGVAEQCELTKFPEWTQLNGTFTESKDWQNDRPAFFSERAHTTFILYYRLAAKAWCINKANEKDSTPLAYFTTNEYHPRDFNSQQWYSGLRKSIPGSCELIK